MPWEGRKLVDGLIVNNLPIDVAKAFGGAVLVAVDIGSPRLEPEDYVSALGVASQVSDLLMRRRYLDFAAEADVLVRPDLGDHSSTDYSGFDELIQKGYEATKASLPAIRAKLAAAGLEDRGPGGAGRRRGRLSRGPGSPRVRVEGSERVSERLARRTFNIPVGPPFAMAKGVRAFDKIDATELFERTWMEFAPASDGVDVVLRVKDAPPNRAEVGLGFTEWERARGSIRLRNQNTLGFGEQVELLLAASDAERVIEASLRGERLFVTGFGYRVSGYTNRDKPRFFTEEGEEINRGRFERDGVDLALRSSLERWGLVEGGVRFGRVKTLARGGSISRRPTTRWGPSSARSWSTPSTTWPGPSTGGGSRSPASGASTASAPISSTGGRSSSTGGRGSLGKRLVAQLDGLAGISGDDLPVYNWYRLGGVTLVPGYHHEELKGAQALAGGAELPVSSWWGSCGSWRAAERATCSPAPTTSRSTASAGAWASGCTTPARSARSRSRWASGTDGSTLGSLSVGWN